MGTQGWDRLEISSCSASYMFDDRKYVGNPDRITYCGAAGDNQQHFPEEAPIKALKKDRNASLKDSLSSLLEDVEEWSAVRLEDDLSILAVEIAE